MPLVQVESWLSEIRWKLLERSSRRRPRWNQTPPRRKGPNKRGNDWKNRQSPQRKKIRIQHPVARRSIPTEVIRIIQWLQMHPDPARTDPRNDQLAEEGDARADDGIDSQIWCWRTEQSIRHPSSLSIYRPPAWFKRMNHRHFMLFASCTSLASNISLYTGVQLFCKNDISSSREQASRQKDLGLKILFLLECITRLLRLMKLIFTRWIRNAH